MGVRRYKAAADRAEALYLAALRNETARERRGDEERYRQDQRSEHVFDGADADQLARRAAAESTARERAAEQRERADASESARREAATKAAAAARARGSAARVAAEEARSASGGARVFTSRDKAAADAAAEREASSMEAAWEQGLDRWRHLLATPLRAAVARAREHRALAAEGTRRGAAKGPGRADAFVGLGRGLKETNESAIRGIWTTVGPGRLLPAASPRSGTRSARDLCEA